MPLHAAILLARPIFQNTAPVGESTETAEMPELAVIASLHGEATESFPALTPEPLATICSPLPPPTGSSLCYSPR